MPVVDVVETPEARVQRFETHVLLLARKLKRRLPPSIELDDLVQAGRLAVFLAGDVPKRLMRCKIWGAMVDSIRGKEYREATRVSMTPTSEEDRPREHADLRPTIEQRMIAAEQVARWTGLRRAQVLRITRAARDPDPLNHPLTKGEQRVIEIRMSGAPQRTIGRALHISQQRVSQMQRHALESLRRKLAA